MRDGLEDVVEPVAVSDSPALPVEPREARPQVARVAESGTIGGDRTQPKVWVLPLRDLMRRRQIQPSFLDPCAAFRDITLGWLEEHGINPEGHDEGLGAPDQKILGEGGFVWLAIAGQDAAGCVALFRRAGGDAAGALGLSEGATAWELGSLGVKPDFRRRGIARLLVDALLRQFGEVAKQGDALFLDLPEGLAEAPALLQSVGFEEAPAVENTGGPVACLRMVYRSKKAPAGAEL
mmetsp:Transcript_100624/g.285111  ORF Transcript_100624/g.285111 Transcript_100624/m.285111 type:complete len:236 (-) Transcript_100624:44-751(-)